MQGHSHIIVGASAAVIANSFLHFFTLPPDQPPLKVIPLGIVIIANVLGSLGPDLDADESRIRHMTNTARSDGCIGKLVSIIMPHHRGWIHSPILAAALVALAMWLRWDWAVAASIGWAAHILADNLMGVLHFKNQSFMELIMVIGAALLAWRYW
jgi:membrane-bound metal-dependent hydrolase YbcI (DUF457 family)